MKTSKQNNFETNNAKKAKSDLREKQKRKKASDIEYFFLF